jgi:hypothetical protein
MYDISEEVTIHSEEVRANRLMHSSVTRITESMNSKSGERIKEHNECHDACF